MIAMNKIAEHAEKKSLLLKKLIEKFIFNIRWMLLPVYVCMSAILGLYVASFVAETAEVFACSIPFISSLIPELHYKHLSSTDMMLTVLEFVDKVMIANLVKMIITGSYNSFVAKDHGFANENISSGILKVKMGTSVVGVSSIHLLQYFVSASTTPWDDLLKMGILHILFIVGGVYMMKIEKQHVEAEKIEAETEAIKETAEVEIENIKKKFELELEALKEKLFHKPESELEFNHEA